MNNQELIRILDKHDLLLVIGRLSSALMHPDDDFKDWFDCCVGSTDGIFDYCEGLTEYQRLKLMQLIINTLIGEAEQSTARHFQALLPFKLED